ncbi:MAG: toprim domain-containing protein, partial [Proteobacteria bacterium]|nr:toprim domain-containing protein [Pseudomonadota bacterium]
HVKLWDRVTHLRPDRDPVLREFAPSEAQVADVLAQGARTRPVEGSSVIWLLDHEVTRLMPDGTVKRVNSAPYRIAIPVRDDNGRLLNIRRYRKPGSKAKQKILSWGKGYGTARLFPAGSKLGEGNIYLCEGEPDTLCAFSRGLEAITQTSKTKQWSQSMLAPFRNRDVVICYDADRAGMEHAQSAANNLAKVAASVRILQWPPFMGQAANGNWPEGGGQDITDFFVTHGKSVQDLQELVAQARLVDKPEEEEASSSSARQFFAKGADNRTSFRPRLLAERIIKDCPLLYDPGTGLLYRWTGQFYELFHEDQVRLMAMHHLGLDAARDRVNDATFQVRILSIIPNGRQTNDQGGWICLKDGMLDLDTGSTAPHDKKYYATYQIPVEVNPTSTPRPERWLRFLEETIQTPEPIAQLQEFFAYCMTKDVRYEKCLLLLGPGGDGKSKIMSVLRHLVGAVNVSAVRFQDLENEFQRAAIYNKLVNMATELGSKAMESDIFKALVSGDYISAAYKHRDPFQFKPFCKLVFAMNRLPRVLDNSEGLFRKLLPIQFKRQFLEGDPARDPDLEEKLLRELPGIFEWALVGLARLRQQRQFTNCAETDELLGLYRVLNNPVAAFVEDNCAVGGHGSCEKGAIYTAYKEYCREGSYYPLGRENFFIELYSVLGSRQETRPSVAGKRERHVQGLILLVTSEGC